MAKQSLTPLDYYDRNVQAGQVVVLTSAGGSDQDPGRHLYDKHNLL